MFLQKIVKDPLVSVPDQEVVDTLERKGVGSTSYSARSAAVGSTRVARPAGSKQANAATASRKAGTSTNVSGSTGVTPKSWLLRIREAEAAAMWRVLS